MPPRITNEGELIALVLLLVRLCRRLNFFAEILRLRISVLLHKSEGASSPPTIADFVSVGPSPPLIKMVLMTPLAGVSCCLCQGSAACSGLNGLLEVPDVGPEAR